MLRCPSFLGPGLSGSRLRTDGCRQGTLLLRARGPGRAPKEPCAQGAGRALGWGPNSERGVSRYPSHSMLGCSVGNTLARISAILTPGIDANWLKPISAFNPNHKDWGIPSLDPLAEPMNTNAYWGAGKSKASPLPEGWQQKADTPELAGAAAGSLRTSPVGRRQKVETRQRPPRARKCWTEPSWESLPQEVLSRELLLLEMFALCCHNYWFALASHLPSPGPAFLIC